MSESAKSTGRGLDVGSRGGAVGYSSSLSEKLQPTIAPTSKMPKSVSKNAKSSCSAVTISQRYRS